MVQRTRTNPHEDFTSAHLRVGMVGDDPALGTATLDDDGGSQQRSLVLNTTSVQNVRTVPSASLGRHRALILPGAGRATLSTVTR